MSILPQAFEDWTIILKINFILSVLFVTLALLLLGTVLYMRILKNRSEERKKTLEILLIDFVNNFLFDEEFDKSKNSVNFKNKHLKTPYDSKIAITQILLFNENLKGESSSLIKELFFGLGLYTFLLKDLKGNAWHKKARALFVFNKLSVEVPEPLVVSQLNSKREEARHQAILYFINSSENDPLSFLDKIDTPLTLWQQIGMENAMKAYSGEIPNFSKWLNHKQQSVVIFCIKMIVDHNQFENILSVQKLVNHPNARVRRQAIVSLRKMEIGEVLPVLIKNFPNEGPKIKQEILKNISKLGSEEELKMIAPHIHTKDRVLKIEYLKIARYFNPKLPKVKKTILKIYPPEMNKAKYY
ncbi:MAG TPA: HEAT repeat domain-containing protein [Leeuwenhoekiella sp.]|nr:HEAT repeat domain-containing protein [Leeuwenhoekiella sp.]